MTASNQEHWSYIDVPREESSKPSLKQTLYLYKVLLVKYTALLFSVLYRERLATDARSDDIVFLVCLFTFVVAVILGLYFFCFMLLLLF